MSIIKKLLALSIAAAILAGCHTVQGAGQDISAGGNAMTNASKKVENKM